MICQNCADGCPVNDNWAQAYEDNVQIWVCPECVELERIPRHLLTFPFKDGPKGSPRSHREIDESGQAVT